MGVFERFLSIWVALAILVGVGLGLVIPEAFQLISRLEWARVNLVIAVLIWLMIYPVMLSLVAFANRTKGWFPAPVS